MTRFSHLGLGALLLVAPLSIAEPMDFALDGSHTHIIWQVDRCGFTNTVGSFTEVEGRLLLDEDNPSASSVTATIALSGLRSDLQEREDIVRGPAWLNAAENPMIRFTSTSTTLVDTQGENDQAMVTGTMTLNGESHPLTLEVKLNKIGTDPVTKRRAAGFTATGSFSRSEFGIAIAPGFIGDQVTFQIEALAIATEPAE